MKRRNFIAHLFVRFDNWRSVDNTCIFQKQASNMINKIVSIIWQTTDPIKIVLQTIIILDLYQPAKFLVSYHMN